MQRHAIVSSLPALRVNNSPCQQSPRLCARFQLCQKRLRANTASSWEIREAGKQGNISLLPLLFRVKQLGYSTGFLHIEGLRFTSHKMVFEEYSPSLKSINTQWIIKNLIKSQDKERLLVITISNSIMTIICTVPIKTCLGKKQNTNWKLGSRPEKYLHSICSLGTWNFGFCARYDMQDQITEFKPSFLYLHAHSPVLVHAKSALTWIR